MTGSYVYYIFLIFTGAALLATLVIPTRQSLLVAYILLGVLLGPSGLKLVPDIAPARQIGDIGIIFLLFLLGVDLSPRELLHTLRKTVVITLISSGIFAGLGIAVGYLFGFTLFESVVIGVALMFSSTVIGLKLLPSRVLHYQLVGEWMVSILLLQDLLAIAVLILVHGASLTGSRLMDMSLAVITLPALLGVTFFLQRILIAPLFRRFEKIQEYIFLLAIGWCLGLAELASSIGLPGEIGAFLAGVSIAEGPVALHIAASLRPLRDFCLVMFFFVIGATFNLSYLPEIWAPALLMAGVMLFAKPYIFSLLLRKSGVGKPIAEEVGFRLGQGSEFSLLTAYMAAASIPELFGPRANYLIQATTLITFVVSSYFVVFRYPTPMSFSGSLRKE